MPTEKNPEQLQLPEFVDIDTFDEEEKIALKGLQQLIQTNPDFAQMTIDMYFDAPDTTDRVMDFISEHPEGGLRALQIARGVIRSRADMAATFDPETEAAIEADTGYRSAIQRFQKTADEKDRTWFRKRRMQIAAKRAKDTLDSSDTSAA